MVLKNENLNVLSMFDGLSGGYLALKKAGININKYYSSEIDKYCLKVHDYHYSDDEVFEKVGDVCKLKGEDFKDIDLVIFGSPCTQLSSINIKDRTGLEGEESKLFYEATRIIREIIAVKGNNNFYFLLENVGSMANSERDKITAELSSIFDYVQLLKIDSAIITPVHRRRYYWTNIPNASIPEQKEANLQDILVNGYTDKQKANVILSTNVTLTNGIFRYYKRNIGNIIFKDAEFAALPLEEKLKQYPDILAKSGYNGKANQNKSLNEYDFPNQCYRLPSVLELSRMMGVGDDYLTAIPNISVTQKQKMLGSGFSIDVIAHLLSNLKSV